MTDTFARALNLPLFMAGGPFSITIVGYRLQNVMAARERKCSTRGTVLVEINQALEPHLYVIESLSA